MALAGYKPTVTEDVPNTKDDEKLVDTNSCIIDGEKLNIGGYLKFHQGTPWNVTYYSQVLGKDDPAMPHDSGLPDVLQQYVKVHNMVIRITSDLSYSQNEDYTNQLQGTGVIYTSRPPNNGDMFIGTLLDGKTGLFTITDFRVLSYTDASVYEITYNLVKLLKTSKDSEIIDLDSKVIKEYYYIDKVTKDNNPLVDGDIYTCSVSLNELYYDMLDYYTRSMLDRTTSTLLIPGQDERIYDPLLVDFLYAIVNTNQSTYMQYIRRLDVNDDKYLDQNTIWTAILKRNIKLLPYINVKMGLTSTSYFSSLYMSSSIRYSRISHVVYPYKPDMTKGLSIELHKTLDSKLVLKDVPSSGPFISSLVTDVNIDPTEMPLINKVTEDDYYVFTEAFYTGEGKMSVLESLVRSYLAGIDINITTLNNVVSTYQSWGGLEQFYYIPVSLVLIRSAIRQYGGKL